MLESTVRHLGIEVDDALEMAKQTEVRCILAVLDYISTGQTESDGNAWRFRLSLKAENDGFWNELLVKRKSLHWLLPFSLGPVGHYDDVIHLVFSLGRNLTVRP